MFMLYSLLVTSMAVSASASSKYVLNTTYQGSTFFDGFDFLTTEPGSGFADYVNESVALQYSMISNGTKGAVRIGVDNTTVLSADEETGRQAVRLQSKLYYQYGLFIADFSHAPGGSCGVWPAYWMEGPNWPDGGELDIFEGVNNNTYNKITGYTTTGSGCTNENVTIKNTLVSSNCSDLDATGCSMESTDDRSWGTGFNKNGGGVYATEWVADTGIKVWFWARGHIPKSVSSSSPDPSKWGEPSAYIPASNCDMDEHFHDMQLILNTNFCGSWTDRTWSSSGCSAKADTCEDFVRNNPSAFTDAYWEVNYIKSYTAQDSTSTESTTVSAVVSTSSASRRRVPKIFSWWR